MAASRAPTVPHRTRDSTRPGGGGLVEAARGFRLDILAVRPWYFVSLGCGRPIRFLGDVWTEERSLGRLRTFHGIHGEAELVYAVSSDSSSGLGIDLRGDFVWLGPHSRCVHPGRRLPERITAAFIRGFDDLSTWDGSTTQLLRVFCICRSLPASNLWRISLER